MAYKHIIWDWNGTLVDDIGLSVDIFNSMMQHNGREKIGKSEYLKYFGFPVSDFYKRYGFATQGEEFSRISRYYIGEYNRRRFECDLREGIEEVLIAVKKEGIGQSILSAYETSALKSALSHYGISDIFSPVSGMDNIYAESKKAIGHRHLSMIQKLYDIGRNEILMIGDTLHDKDVADSIGIASILLSSGHNSEERLKSSGSRVIMDAKEIMDYILCRIRD